MSQISEWFWAESVWLPANISWSDVANGSNKRVVYADLKDFLYVFPMGVIIFLFRYVLERYCFTPVGKSLGIADKNTRKFPHNEKLEAAYLALPKRNNFSNLAKELNITKIYVKRWWRLRSNLYKSSKLAKFGESMWKTVFYTLITLYGLYVLWDKEWLWDTEKCFKGYPHQGITDDIRRYYMFQAANYWHQLIFQFRAIKRKDSFQMYVHHTIAIFLITMSWISSMYRIGTLILILHECADIPLEAGKATKYARFHSACNYIFVVFMTSWIVTRIIVFPIYIIPLMTDYVRNATMYYVLKLLLWVLFGLHIIWTSYIIQVAYRAMKVGEIKGDARSSDSEDNEISNHID